MQYKFEVGDRVDYTFVYEDGQGTPGTVKQRNVLTGRPYYLVEWDDGFTEDGSLPVANLWPEDELVYAKE